MTRPTLITIGDIVADLLTVISFPIEPGKIIMTDLPLLEPGGACNFAITGARLAAQVRMIGAPGRDTFGNRVMDVLRAEGVDTSLVTPLDKVPTTLVMVLADLEKFTQTYISSPVHSEGFYAFDESVSQALDSADALYIQGYVLCEDYLWQVARQAMEYVQGRIPVYFDPSPLFVNADRNRQLTALALVNVILGTHEEIDTLYPGAGLDRTFRTLFNAQTQMIVMKRAGQGCRVITPEGSTDYPAYPVQAIGAAGAGDSFNAGFVIAQRHGLSIDQSAKVANAAGAVKVTRLGGGTQAPTMTEIYAILTANGEGALADEVAGWRVD